MKSPTWLLKEVVMALHEQLINEFGGSSGLRDLGLLESALARPQHLHAYTQADFFALAASYAFGLIKNHPFVDGNKRIGFVAAATFLELNNYAITAAEVDAVVQTLALAAGACTEADYTTWLSQNSIPNSPP